MAEVKFFKLGVNGRIIDMVAVDENDCKDADNNFDENLGIQFLNNITGWPLWISKMERLGTPQLDGYYLEDFDVFKAVPENDIFTFNTTTAEWDHPTIPRPTNNNITHNGTNLELRPYWLNDRWEGSAIGNKENKFYWNTDTNSWTLIT
jgi:hypothetical protein